MKGGSLPVVDGCLNKRRTSPCLGEERVGLAADPLKFAFWPPLREEDTLKTAGQPVDNRSITNECGGTELLQQTVTQATG